ncbi:hypothetical protein ACIOG4_37465 [Streptomyces microflavus]|uniref:hypothetical protein n=1 Tax=Streptomyces microflavus TaxID=1919 RepID=UPI00380E7F01
MRLTDLPAGTFMLSGSVVTAVEARELAEDDVLDVGGTTVTVTGTAGHAIPGMTCLSVTWHPYEDDRVRCEQWTLPAATRLTPRLLLRPERVECAVCDPGTRAHDVLVDRVTEGWVQSWVCDGHLTLPGLTLS